jgi:hypothetical protein
MDVVSSYVILLEHPAPNRAAARRCLLKFKLFLCMLQFRRRQGFVFVCVASLSSLYISRDWFGSDLGRRFSFSHQLRFFLKISITPELRAPYFDCVCINNRRRREKNVEQVRENLS